MKKWYSLLLLLIAFSSCALQKQKPKNTLPQWMKGSFTDDYSIRYTITDEAFRMDSIALYHIISWNEKEKYLVVKNDQSNRSEKGLYTRIDYEILPDMQPFEWAFCFTVYDAANPSIASQHPPANRNILKKGCNGFPFTRLKRRL